MLRGPYFGISLRRLSRIDNLINNEHRNHELLFLKERYPVQMMIDIRVYLTFVMAGSVKNIQT